MERVAVRDFHLSHLAPGVKQRWCLEVADSLIEPTVVPLLTCRGTRPGPTLLAVAGVHGDEFEGMAAVHRVFDGLTPNELSGTFLALPIANPWAYQAQQRTTPPAVDGLNLARLFPGNAQGSPTERLAAALFAFAVHNLTEADLLVDLHSGGSRYRYLPMAGFRQIDNAARAPSEEAARHFGIDRIWGIANLRGMFNAETARHGIPTLGTEITGHGACREGDVNIYTQGLLNLLRYRGMLPGQVVRNATAARSTHPLTASQPGFFIPSVDLGASVEPDQVLGRIVDVYGDLREQLRADRAGEIWAIRAFSTLYPGDIAFLVASL